MYDTARRSVVIAALLASVAALPAAAQTGSLRVRVLSEARQLMAGVMVTLSSSQGLIAPTATLTDEDGEVEFPVLRAGGGYAVLVSMSGYATLRRSDLAVHAGSTTTVELVLTLPTTEKVEALAQTPAVDLDRVGSSTKFTDEFIENLPQRGRVYQDILPKTPGVLDHDGDGNPNVHGGRTRDFRAEVGGISNVDPLTGQWLSYINLDTIEEMEVITTGAGVEFGRAQGGFARIIQKQGTNRFEGVFGFLYRSSKLDGDGAGSFNALPRADYDTVQPSLQLSGPLVRDKLWFRLSHEVLERQDPINLLGQLTVTTTEQTISADQITWQVTPRNKLAFQYQHDPLSVDNLGVSSSTPPESTRTFERGGPTYSLSWVAPVSERLLFDSVVAYQDHTHDIVPSQPDATQDCLHFHFMPAMDRARCFNLTTNRFSGPHSEASRDRRQRFTARTQVTSYRRLWGQSHQLKFGLGVENERYFRGLERAPELTARRLSSLEWCQLRFSTPPFQGCAGEPEPPLVEFTKTIPAPRETHAEATGNSWALYVEDQWKPKDNLSVTFGLRYDSEEIQARGFRPFSPEAQAGAFLDNLQLEGVTSEFLRDIFTTHEDITTYRESVAQALGISSSLVNLSPTLIQGGFWSKRRRVGDISISNGNLAPRLSVAWDPWHDGKTKFALSAGRYYDKIFLAVPLVEAEAPVTRVTFLATPFPGLPESVRRTVTIQPLSAKLVDRNLRTPYQDEFTLAAEREIFRETSVRAMYVRRKFRDQLQDIDINHLPGDHGRCDVEEIQQGDPDFFDPFRDFSVVPSEGEGQTLTDWLTGEEYVDTDPGPGDGRLDDCGGNLQIVQFPFQGGSQLVDTPDGRPDLFVQNPVWEELLLVGNFNTTDYRAIVLEGVRRLYRDWQLEASYTWSRAEGQAEDFDLTLGNEQNLREDEAGFLDYDQRHVAQVNVTTQAWGFRFGTSVRWQSGLPYSILRQAPIGFFMPPSYPFQRVNAERPRLRYPTGQRNDRRNPDYWNVDLRVSREIRVKRSVLQLSIEAFNLFNDDSVELENSLNGEVSGTRRFGTRWQLGLRWNF